MAFSVSRGLWRALVLFFGIQIPSLEVAPPNEHMVGGHFDHWEPPFSSIGAFASPALNLDTLGALSRRSTLDSHLQNAVLESSPDTVLVDPLG